MKLIVAGSRSLDIDGAEVRHWVHQLGLHYSELTEIVSGASGNTDLAGEEFAKDYHIPVKRFPPDWGTHGKAAGPIRNVEMAMYADALLAFREHGAENRGTHSMITEALAYGIDVYVVTLYNEE